MIGIPRIKSSFDNRLLRPKAAAPAPLPDAPTIPKTPPSKPDSVPARTVPTPSQPQRDPDTAPGGVPCPPSECPHPR